MTGTGANDGVDLMDDLMAAVEHLRQENAAWRAENEELKRENAALKRRIDELLAEIREREGEDG